MFKKSHTPFQRPNKKITDKAEIVSYAEEYLKTNSLIDMNGFIHDEMEYPEAETSFIRDTAYLMWGSGHYEFADTYKRDEYLLIKKPSWTQRYPSWFAFTVTVLSVGLSVIATKLDKQDTTQLQFLKDSRQDTALIRLSDEVKTVRNHLQNQPANSKSASKDSVR